MQKFVNVVLVFILAIGSVIGQVPDQLINAELKKRGLTRTEVESELLSRGVNLAEVDPNNAVEVAQARSVLEEVLDDLERKKKTELKEDNKKEASKTFESVLTAKEKAVEAQRGEVNDAEIIEAVNDGATVEEAVAEQISMAKADRLPDAIIYGQHLYRDKSIKFFEKSADALPPSLYVIGPGDGIAVEIWGVSEASMSFKVNKEGYIKPNKMNRIYVSGLTIAEAENLIVSRLKRRYNSNSNFEVNIVTSRTININIGGEVFDPGSYNVSALNNAINALVAAGGPTNLGSVRNIKLLQAGKTKNIDLYKYLLDPSIEQDFYLTENDYIVVPVANKVVTITGAVKRPYRYELLSNEGLKALIDYAGGLKYNAFKQNIKVTRVQDDVEVIIDVDLNEVLSGRKSFDLLNGDKISVRTIPAEYRNVVRISGAVQVPGEYAFEPGMKLADLAQLGKPKDAALLSMAYLIRLNDDFKTVSYDMVDVAAAMANPRSDANIALKRGDKIEIRSGSQFADTYSISVNGAVRSPGEYRLDREDLKIADAIFLSSGLRDDASDLAYLIRKEPGEKTPSYINVDIKAAIANPQSDANITLQSNDRLMVYSNKRFSDDFSVAVSGAVRSSGSFPYITSMTLKDAILLAGGPQFNADLARVDVYRLEFVGKRRSRTLVANVELDENLDIVSGQPVELRPFDEIILRRASEFEFNRFVRVNGEVAFPGKYGMIKDNMRLSDLVAQSGGLTDEAFVGAAKLLRSEFGVGKVIISLAEALKDQGGDQDLILLPGDELTIPKISQLVTIQGATKANEVLAQNLLGQNREINLAFAGKRDADKYINEYAGGFNDNADRSRLTVQYPNGELKRTRRFLFFRNYPKVEPGSIIRVPLKKVEKVENSEEQNKTDWGEVMSNSVAQATAVLSLLLLVRSLD